ncbi:MAG TPA: flavin reductase [Candidatus Desulfofervidus auxilii]|uniref:Flavin reductase n=1 Tax=Desulfofervidus auxilii TaxID=1621989 RepID=A0A7C0U1M0_DESA2|nr:flavin reductase [Candidatus Desulfofervidus auxilii]
MQDIIAKALMHGVYVVTVKAEGRKNGMTAAWVSQVSFKPPLIMVSIAPARYTHGLIKSAGYFAINTLSEDQIEIAKHFGFKSGRKTDKLANLEHFEAGHGSPVLKDALAYIECKLVNTFEAGDHTLFIGEAIEGKVLKEGKQPLLFIWERFF